MAALSKNKLKERLLSVVKFSYIKIIKSKVSFTEVSLKLVSLVKYYFKTVCCSGIRLYFDSVSAPFIVEYSCLSFFLFSFLFYFNIQYFKGNFICRKQLS